jgi:transforming growth factor-beta-induced protein
VSQKPDESDKIYKQTLDKPLTICYTNYYKPETSSEGQPRLVRRVTMNRFKKVLPALVAVVLLAGSAAPAFAAPPAPGSRGAPAPGDSSIAEIAIGAGFSELVGALAYVDAELDAGLVDLFLNGTDQYTVFAPTNEAFENLYTALGVNGIEDLPPELVLDVLLYHVTEGRRAANSVVPPVRPREITTLLGAAFTVDRDATITDVLGQEVSIVAANISASNGIIHVIDTVLVPLESL